LIRRLVLLFLFAIVPTSSHASVVTAHLLSFQGQARDGAQQPVGSGDVRVRIYDAATGGALVYDSNGEFAGAIQGGVFSVLLGSGAPLLLDNTRQYYLELDINGAETIGDAASGRQAFWPGGGDHSRSDLESRISSLEAMVNPTCAAGTFNLDGNPANGCEFTLDPSGIYVDASDPGALDDATAGLGPSGTGGSNHPCRTIGFGLSRAATTGRANVYVANGNYVEAVTLANGKNLRGGYRSGTWERQLAATATVIRGESPVFSHKRAVSGTNIASPTLLEGFVIFGPANSSVGGNTYAIYLSNAGGVTLQSNIIYGGSAGPGQDGSNGTAGGNGVAGTAGANALQQATTTCAPATNRPGGAGGVLSCAGTSANGGAGGGNRCTPVANTEFSALDGSAAPGAGGGTAGDAGDDGQVQAGTCFPPTSATAIGGAGGAGAGGANGSGGAGAIVGTGSVIGGNWAAQAGGAGINGTPGRGGGGGGGGGGADGISGEKDLFGGAGGGGGSGACGGSAASGGDGGGGSFGIFVIGGSAPVIQGNVIIRGTGGGGGRGGIGASGGIGGSGAAGGTSAFSCASPGGRGGDGGNGGASGGGGGGAGGISCGIYTSGVGTPGYGSNTISGGASGPGGSGGTSPGNAGSPGIAGQLTSISSN